MEPMLRDLAAHLRWADAMAFHALHKHAAATAEADVLDRLHHTAMTSTFFAALLEGRALEVPPKVVPPFEEIRRMTREAGDRLLAWAERAEGAELQRPIHVPWFGDPPFELPAQEALLQALLHAQHHRAQTMTRLKQLGGKAVNVDYILWIWKGRPEPRWD